MTLQVTQAVIVTGIAPSALTPAATDTIAASSFGPNGLIARVITTGTATTVATLDPNLTIQGNPASVTGVTCSSTGVMMIYIPLSAINTATGLASLTFSGARTGVTYELYKV